jgi:hypothetical protein
MKHFHVFLDLLGGLLLTFCNDSIPREQALASLHADQQRILINIHKSKEKKVVLQCESV